MKERPILFSAPMVRALLAGTKTQTRRVIKPQPTHFNPAGVPRLANPVSGPAKVLACPYPLGNQQGLVQPAARGACAGCGAVVDSGHRIGGDCLYVRETWAAPHAYDHLPPRLIPQDARIHYAATEDRGGLLWRPSIHMPRHASRITLEITGIRVERLQDISEADAIAEGCDNSKSEAAAAVGWHEKPRRAYRRVWESINGAGSWDANPWVWVVGFKRLEGGAE